MPSPQKRAQEVWEEVLARMPAQYHRKFALVEARRSILGVEDHEEVFAEIDRLAEQAFGPGHVAQPTALEKAPAPKLTPKPVEDQIRYAVYSAMEGTTDGSPENRAHRRRLALEQTEQIIKSQSNLGWLKKRQLRAFARRFTEEQLDIAMRLP